MARGTALTPLLLLTACPVFQRPANPPCDRETIEISPGPSYDFGPVIAGETATVEFELYQDYCGAVQVKSITTTGNPVFALGSKDAGLNDEYFYANSTGLVTFAPTDVGSFAGVLIVTTSSSKDPTLQLSLTGQGIPPGPACTTDSRCDAGAFCDGTYCQPHVCGGFSNLPDSGGRLACAPESSACQGDAGWELVDTQSDPRNCGGCGQACAAGRGCSGGRCGSCVGYRIGGEQDFLLDLPAFGVGAGLRTLGLVVGDFDGDGRSDVLLALETGVLTGNVESLQSYGLLVLNDGDGGFWGKPRTISLCDGPLRVGDFNGDCVLDVAAGGAIMLNDGHGNFPTRNNLPDLGVDLLVRDFNQDGKPDLLFAAQDESRPNGPFVAFGDGRGGFATAPSFAPGFELYVLSSGNFDGDGRPGVAGFAFRADAGPLYCFSNEDGGSLELETAYADPGADAFGGLPASFAAAQLTEEGHAALVYGEASSVIALPDPAQRSTDAILLGLDAGFAELTVGDLDLDGRADILATEGRGTWAFGSGSPIFVADGGFALDLWTGFAGDGGQLLPGRLQSVPTNFPPVFLQVADLNGDGIPDILAVSSEYSLQPDTSGPPHLMVFLGSCAP